MGQKDRPPMFSLETQAVAQIALQELNRLSALAANGAAREGAALISSLIPQYQDEKPEICLDEEALATLSPRERLAFAFSKLWAGNFNDNFGYDCSIPTGVFSELYQENIDPFGVAIGRTIQGILQPTSEFGQTVVENMIQTNESYRTLVARANQLSSSLQP